MAGPVAVVDISVNVECAKPQKQIIAINSSSVVEEDEHAILIVCDKVLFWF